MRRSEVRERASEGPSLPLPWCWHYPYRRALSDLVCSLAPRPSRSSRETGGHVLAAERSPVCSVRVTPPRPPTTTRDKGCCRRGSATEVPSARRTHLGDGASRTACLYLEVEARNNTVPLLRGTYGALGKHDARQPTADRKPACDKRRDNSTSGGRGEDGASGRGAVVDGQLTGVVDDNAPRGYAAAAANFVVGRACGHRCALCWKYPGLRELAKIESYLGCLVRRGLPLAAEHTLGGRAATRTSSQASSLPRRTLRYLLRFARQAADGKTVAST